MIYFSGRGGAPILTGTDPDKRLWWAFDEDTREAWWVNQRGEKQHASNQPLGYMRGIYKRWHPELSMDEGL